MRQIKSRGKRLDSGEWIYGDLIENQGRFFIYHATSETTIRDSDDGHITVMAIAVDNGTVAPFTEFHDKNGKEIYGGDIIKRVVVCKLVADVIGTIEIIGVIEWHQTGFIFKVSENDIKIKEVHRISHLNTEHKEEVEIIGNIHDNPELIKRKYK